LCWFCCFSELDRAGAAAEKAGEAAEAEASAEAPCGPHRFLTVISGRPVGSPPEDETEGWSMSVDEYRVSADADDGAFVETPVKPPVDPSQAEVSALLRSKGVRPTRARCGVMSLLRDTTTHPSTDSILDGLRERGCRVPVATLYQNINTLVDYGLVSKFLDGRGVARFDGNTEPHCHLICTQCGRIDDAEEYFEVRPKGGAESLSDLGWEIGSDGLFVHGICPACKDGH